MLEVGAIALVPFPYTDLSASKRRPVLLLTDINERGDFIAVALTSRPQTDGTLCLPAGPLARGGALPSPSWIRIAPSTSRRSESDKIPSRSPRRSLLTVAISSAIAFRTSPFSLTMASHG